MIQSLSPALNVLLEDISVLKCICLDATGVIVPVVPIKVKPTDVASLAGEPLNT